LAIVVDDEIDSAPVVKSAIGGGHISITIGAGASEAQMKQAQSLARRLRGR
jgi:preprotein translocase subunit SecD